MTGRRWIFLAFATVLAVIGVNAAIAYVIDPYGVLRDSAGRKLSVYANERKVKFLMNKRYVPTNFDGLIVGTSSSANWDIPTLDGAKMFNESLEGGDAVEGRILVDEAMRTGHFKLAIFILSHAMTKESSVKDGLGTANAAAAIGSLYLFSDEIHRVEILANHRFIRSDTAPNGQIELLYQKNLTPLKLASNQLLIDPVAVQQYSELINSLRATGTKIVYVIPPMYEPCYQVNKIGYEANLHKARSLLPSAPLLDFDEPEYLAFRSDPDNYLDCFHLEPRGAAKIAALLEKLVPEAGEAAK